MLVCLKVLKGNAENFSGILDVNNFEANLKAINKSYEEHVLSVGDFDERIFLGKWLFFLCFLHLTFSYSFIQIHSLISINQMRHWALVVNLFNVRLLLLIFSLFNMS